MGVNFFKKKALPLALTASMVLSATPVLAASSDLDGHWAKNVITEWQEKGLIKGYADGTFKPNNSITRAEFVVLMNNAQGYSKSTDISFTDVAEGDWYYDAVAKAVKAGYTKGYENGTFQPNKTITRAEAAVMIANAAGLSADESGASFTDAASIPAWAKGSIGAAANAGYLSGYPDGSFGATKSITRAEAVSSLNRMLGAVEAEKPVEEVKKEDVVIKESGTTLENEKISGDLIIDEAVGDGEVYLNSVEVDGDLLVQGGGKNSLYLTDSTVNGKIDLQKTDVHLHISGDSNVSQIDMSEPSRVTFDESFEGTVDNVNIPEDAPKGEYSIEAEDKDATPVKNLNVDAETTVTVSANVSSVNVGENAEGSKITVSENTTIGTVNTEADTTIDGKGSVENLNTNGNSVDTDKNLNVDKTDGDKNTDKNNDKNTNTSNGNSGNNSSNSGSSNKKTTVNTLSVGMDGAAIMAVIDQKVPVSGTTVTVTAITASGNKTLAESEFSLDLLDYEDFTQLPTTWNFLVVDLSSFNPAYTFSGFEISVSASGYSFSTITINEKDTLLDNPIEVAHGMKDNPYSGDYMVFSIYGAASIDKTQIIPSVYPDGKGLTAGTISTDAITNKSTNETIGTEVRIEITGTPTQAGIYLVKAPIPADAITPVEGYTKKATTALFAIDVEDDSNTPTPSAPVAVTVTDTDKTVNGNSDKVVKLTLDKTDLTLDTDYTVTVSKDDVAMTKDTDYEISVTNGVITITFKDDKVVNGSEYKVIVATVDADSYTFTGGEVTLTNDTPVALTFRRGNTASLDGTLNKETTFTVEGNDGNLQVSDLTVTVYKNNKATQLESNEYSVSISKAESGDTITITFNSVKEEDGDYTVNFAIASGSTDKYEISSDSDNDFTVTNGLAQQPTGDPVGTEPSVGE